MINSLTNKLAFRQIVPDLTPGTSTGFIDADTGYSVPDPRLPKVDTFTPSVSQQQQTTMPIEARMGDTPDLARRMYPKGAPDTRGDSNTGYVHGGHSV